MAALLADIAAANSGRRAAIVGARGGAVVDWLLEAVAKEGGGGTQAESARALAYLIADPNVSAAVLGRPHAVPNLLRFIFSCQPRRSKNKKVNDSLCELLFLCELLCSFLLHRHSQTEQSIRLYSYCA